MKVVRLVIFVFFAIFLLSCQNPVKEENQASGIKDNSIVKKDTNFIYNSSEIFTCIYNNTSENYADYLLKDSVTFYENEIIYFEFDYLIITKAGDYSNNLQFGDNINNAFILGKLNQTNYNYLHYSGNYRIEVPFNSYLRLRITIQYNTLVYVIKNLKIYR